MGGEARKRFRTEDGGRQPARTPEYTQGIADSKGAILYWGFTLKIDGPRKNGTSPGPIFAIS